MGYREFFVSVSNVFSGYQKPFESADYVVFGVPFDWTSTYRSGARFAPQAIREASLNLETYSFRTGLDVEELRIHDLGDLHVSSETEETLSRVGRVVKELLKAGKTPVLLGGEHTISLGAAQALNGNFSVISFDAHLDLRDEYMERRVSHATFMRRLHEQFRPFRIVELGTRAVSKEELNYAERNADISFITSSNIVNGEVEEIVKRVRKLLEGCDRVYLTIDMDVLDPAYAPAVQNPEPNGLDIRTLLELLYKLCDNHVVAFDLVEVTPHYDTGVTALQASKILFESLCQIEKSRKENLANRDLKSKRIV